MKIPNLISTALALALTTGCPSPAFALGDLLVAPTRVIFEGNKRSFAISLVNTGKEVATYRVSFLNQRMTEAGAFEEVKQSDPQDHFADGLVRFTPKQVILAPGVSQVVRLQLHKNSDLPDGEYRSHLLFRAIPPISNDVPDPNQKTLSVRLIPVYGVSIPVIVRQGMTSASVRLSDLKISRGKNNSEPPELSVRINREGNRSIYGDISVDFIPKGGERKTLQRISGLAVYTQNASRVVKVSLQGQNLTKGRLQVTFKETVEAGASPSPQASPDVVAADIGIDMP